MIDDDKDLQEAFLQESIEHIEKLEKELLELENDINNKQLINSVFRSYHTIKASSAYMKFDNIKKIAHKVENILDNVRKGKNSLTSNIISYLFKSVDLMKELIANNDKGININNFVNSLDNFKISDNSHSENFKFIKKDVEGDDFESDYIDEDNIKNKYIIFQVAKALFGIELLFVEEITKIIKGTFIPYVENYITQLMNIRGELVALFDLRRKFNLRPKTIESSRIIIIKYDDSLIGLKTDAVKFILNIEKNKIKQLNRTFKDFNSDFVKGFFMYNKKPVVILNLDTLLKRGD